MRRKLVAGNWKMYGSLSSNNALLDGIVEGVRELHERMHCAVCVPFPYLYQAQAVLRGSTVAWGAQNSSEHAKGAYTGEVAPAMLVDFGCRYVILGHSERRALYGDDDAQVARKVAAALAAGLTPIVCIGETLTEREQGVTQRVVARQLDAVLDQVGERAVKDCVLAYEPVWAIGTGKTATPEQAQEVHAFVRSRLGNVDQHCAQDTLILYGGSVKASNASQLFGMPDIDGGLIGGASLDSGEFVQICASAALPLTA
ncbi:MAG: triose-phosphate isomerase [Burkholderiales bacterium]